MTNLAKKYNITPDESKLITKTCWRSLSLSASYTFERMQALGYLYTMIPAINKYYDKKEDRIEAYKRHFELFNTTPTVGTFITGLTASMEKEAAQDKDFDTSSINALKVALMGPFAGIGDSIFWGSLRIISLGIGISIAQTGSVLGAIVHLVLFNVIASLVRYYGEVLGFGLGSDFLKKAASSGVMNFVTKAAGIVGLMTVGAMTCTMVNFQIPFVLNISGAELSIQSFFDGIFPNVLPLLLVFGCFGLVKKGISATWLIFGVMIIGIAGRFFGIL